ncbi:MAG: hypothetical protein CM1200mP2_30920 [Planctomycetaceae bacterium]|nr:MAG: hypothetical protein CM1200mP2_30920 [Planctomycetaceae bacterium]
MLKHQPEASGRHFRVLQNVDDFGRITVVFDDHTVAEVVGSDLSISGIRNELRVITDFAQYDMRINPNNENELFLPMPRPPETCCFEKNCPPPRGPVFPGPASFMLTDTSTR